MPNTNLVIIEGRLGQTPNLDKKPYRISVATTRGYGEKKQTDWHDITIWSDTALNNAEKGDIVHIIGHMAYSKVEEKTYRNIVADSVSVEKKKKKDDDFVEE